MSMTGSVDPRLMESLRWRCIGPPRGGRVVAAAGDPCDPMVFYFGAVGGGVWKTTDGGHLLGAGQRRLLQHRGGGRPGR